jgi:hypothetical protein
MDLMRPPQDPQDAGHLLVEVVRKLSSDYEEVFFNFEHYYLEELFAMAEQNYFLFVDHHVEAIRCCAVTRRPTPRLLKYLLQKAKAQSIFAKGKNALHVLIQFLGLHTVPPGGGGNLPVAEVEELLPTLIANGADISSFDDTGGTPTYYACYYGLCGTFFLLVDAGADLSTTHKRYAHPFTYLDPRYWNRPHQTTLNLLEVAANASLEYYRTLDQRYGSVILYLLDYGLECHDKYPITDILFRACFQGNIVLVEALLHHGIDVNSRAYEGLSSPIHAATFGGRNELVHLLIDHGANVKLRTQVKGMDGKKATAVEGALAQPIGRRPFKLSFVRDGARWPDHILRSCAVLVKSGAGVEDTVRFICACAREGRWSIMASILRPKRNCRKCEMVECLTVDGYEQGSEARSSLKSRKMSNEL